MSTMKNNIEPGCLALVVRGLHENRGKGCTVLAMLGDLGEPYKQRDLVQVDVPMLAYNEDTGSLVTIYMQSASNLIRIDDPNLKKESISKKEKSLS